MRKKELDAYFNSLIAARLTDCGAVAAAYKGETAYAFCGADRIRPAYAGFVETTRLNIGSAISLNTRWTTSLCIISSRILQVMTTPILRFPPRKASAIRSGICAISTR